MEYYPTGALSVVAHYMEQARSVEQRIPLMLKNDCWNTAIDQYLEARKLRERAGIELLLWTISVLQLPDEPKP